MNLIISELAISILGTPLDFMGNITNGSVLNNILCPLGGFTNTFFGKWNTKYLNKFLINEILRKDVRLDMKFPN